MPRRILIVLSIVAVMALILLCILLLDDVASTAVDSNRPGRSPIWLEDDSLLGGRVSEWHFASYESRLASCGSAILLNLSDDRNVDWDRLKEMAVMLESRIDERVADGKLDSAYVAGIVANELVAMGVMRQSGDKYVIDLDK
ncbi:MAG: hypothetical protein D8M59_12765 [Planctomycetes bacterium]|nr:hypothetical protein [Planctomycetota bacterium]NOG53689.1 hypothetical protein [Planctomycetota bacterium]